ncbi:hypothetical protein PPACK8108_LOCUS12555 [Phakopsora pachyrhizi]|uniref:Uncharacterized protein n=1 Tax=Phakopsora pachyrhizi TaxID=170000 RepID=A0AAV0B227_PHAPC|nr:hypothetical protein PPACK8108_LOCUS12555 [Phakopsora pachyrhizi]
MNDVQVEESTNLLNKEGKNKAEEIEEDEPLSNSSKRKHLEAEESFRSSLMFGGSQETLLTRPSTAASAGRASTVLMKGNLPSQYAAEINQRMNEVE